VQTNQLFTDLLTLSKKITDYGDDDDEVTKDPDEERREGQIDDDTGVAVVFDEEEEEDEMDGDEEDGGGFEVDDASDEEDAAAGDEMPVDGIDSGEDEVRIGRDGAAANGASSGLSARDIDAYWLQREVGKVYTDPSEGVDQHAQLEKANSAFEILSSGSDLRDCENQLMEVFDFTKFELVGTLVQNRDLIVWCTRLARADAEERVNVEVAMREKGVGSILKELAGTAEGKAGAARNDAMDVDTNAKPTTRGLTTQASALQPQKTIDIDGMIFEQGARLMSNKKTTLPEGSFKRTKKSYEEVHVPAPAKGEVKPGELVPIISLPQWAQPAFPGATNLNRVQSRLYPVAFHKDDPILLCAPTGAGKVRGRASFHLLANLTFAQTNVAMLTILREVGKHLDEATGHVDLDAFKIVYIAPMKALVQEMVGNFGQRLEPYGVKVSELTGDRQLTKQQIAETQMIITTPEKWDVITRKSTDTSYTNLVRLIIIDEIHLLHDDRGPVLEAIVSRTLRRAEQTHDDVRLVGLSATLPNFRDVARFLRVNPAAEGGGLFEFDRSYRPCPLKQQFVGVTEKRAILRHQIMNEVCYEKVLEHAGVNQVLVFVHSRKETAKTAKTLRDMAVDKDTITSFIRPDSASREILLTEAEKTASDGNLKDLLPFGFAIHHAGMTRVDRGLVEDLFADGHIQVLVCTATLAWGVNLPAHAVIIKGTQIYNPEKGRWQELSPQDVLQVRSRSHPPRPSPHLCTDDRSCWATSVRYVRRERHHHQPFRAACVAAIESSQKHN
jgi:pre-mRNA-splicing helicase BRR2